MSLISFSSEGPHAVKAAKSRTNISRSQVQPATSMPHGGLFEKGVLSLTEVSSLYVKKKI